MGLSENFVLCLSPKRTFFQSYVLGSFSSIHSGPCTHAATFFLYIISIFKKSDDKGNPKARVRKDFSGAMVKLRVEGRERISYRRKGKWHSTGGNVHKGMVFEEQGDAGRMSNWTRQRERRTTQSGYW